MTPQEELFKELFNHETSLVRDMDILTLRAHREELEKIAFEARARLSAADAAEKEKTRKDSSAKPTGFQRNVNVDESVNNEAVNIINKRKAKQSKSEKIQAGLKELFIAAGMSEAEASIAAGEKMSAGKIVSHLVEKIENQTATESDIKSKEIMTAPSKSESEAVATQAERKPFVNPFAKK